MDLKTTDECINLVLDDEKLVRRIRNAKILMVGAGGIGCEVLKTMILSGFKRFNVIDLDTIDVSNLNRQFLFNKSHVGQFKAQVACNVASDRFAHADQDGYSLNAILDPVQKPDFDIDFFKSHTIVINALDNIQARSHVNRMCLAADVPLIESGTEGYVGQVFVIKKGVTACYECEGPRQAQKTYASCTIRNTPSLPIHCIVWGKHLFAQLFGESDPDNDVSPDVNDPELQNGHDENAPDAANGNSNGDNANGNGNHGTNGNGDAPAVAAVPSTRSWAESVNYDPQLLFEKLFDKDVQYLLKMDRLWESRAKPVPLSFNDLTSNQIPAPSVNMTSQSAQSSGTEESDLEDQTSWTLKECFDKFAESIKSLKERINEETPFLVWDKDDEPALNFVTAVSNLRSQVFNIERKSKFDVKSMAGNIIPAISSTNAIIGGIITAQAIEILSCIKDSEPPSEDLVFDPELIYERCRHTYLKVPSATLNNLIASYELSKPNPKCIVCADSREVKVQLCIKETTVGQFVDQIIFSKLGFVCPDIYIDQSVIWNKEDADDETAEEKAASNARKLSDLTLIRSGVRLKVYDLQQELTIFVTIEDAKIDPAINDGLFYKLIVTNEGSTAVTEEDEKGDGMLIQEVDTSKVITVQDVEDDDDEDIMAVDTNGSSNGTAIDPVAAKLKRGPEDVGGSHAIDSPIKKLRTSSDAKKV